MTLITCDQILAHLVGDYIFQSDWVATTKKDRIWPCLIHSILYTLPFLLLTQSWKALALVGLSHFVVDHWKLPQVIAWLKNLVAPKSEWVSWSKCVLGFPSDRPIWLVAWLVIIIDNTIHLIINGLCLKYL
jgi:hypothetical protein